MIDENKKEVADLKVLSYWNLNGEELQEQLKEMIFLKYYHIGI